MNEDQLKEYIKNPEHGLVKERKVGDVKIQTIYKPTDLVIAQDLSSDSLQKENYKKHYYFIVNLSKNDQEIEASYVKDRNVFRDQVKKMTFGMYELARIVTSEQDTITTKDFMYQRMFGSTGQSTFVVTFDNEKLKEAAWFELFINYPELGIAGEKFKFEKEDLDNIPDLKVN